MEEKVHVLYVGSRQDPGGPVASVHLSVESGGELDDVFLLKTPSKVLWIGFVTPESVLELAAQAVWAGACSVEQIQERANVLKKEIGAERSIGK